MQKFFFDLNETFNAIELNDEKKINGKWRGEAEWKREKAKTRARRAKKNNV